MIRILPFLLGLFLFPLNSNAQWAGNALDFDGSDDYIDCPLPPVFNAISSNSFTVELWTSPDVGNFERLFFAQLDANNFASISLNSTGEVVFYLSENGANHSVQSSNTMNPLEWAHIAVTWDATSQEAKIFLNGDEAMYTSGLYVSSTGTDAKMTFGSKTDGSQNFNGMMDELNIWSVAKSECEISFEMNDKKIGSEPNIIGAYVFDLGIPGGANPSELITTDLALPYEDGTLMNFALNGTTSNWIESYANLIRLWGTESQAFLGQLGLVSTIAADQFQWIYCADGTPVTGAINVTFDPPTEDPIYTGVNDSYAVISSKGNCVDTSECFLFNGNVSVDEVDNLTQLSIYPNPSVGQFNVELPVGSEIIEVISLTGDLVYQAQVLGLNEVAINLSELNGFYFVQVKTESAIISSKIVVKNE